MCPLAALAPTQLRDEEPESESSAPALAREAVQPCWKVNGSLGFLFLGHGCVQSPAPFPWAALGSLNPPLLQPARQTTQKPTLGQSPQASRGELSSIKCPVRAAAGPYQDVA